MNYYHISYSSHGNHHNTKVRNFIVNGNVLCCGAFLQTLVKATQLCEITKIVEGAKKAQKCHKMETTIN